ncbi:MAG: hypothetical protein IAE84_14140 [Saprospiraceae bacterium]|nr:hypothetical protein [Saprospiraceae bacterium]
MPKQRDLVFKLIKSLTKAEKRHFRLFVARTKSGEEALFLQLFDLFDRAREYDEKAIRTALPAGMTPTQLANLKRHLYQQIMVSLRLISTSKHIDLEIREQIDFARILYSKGHYMESLHTLERIKNVAEAHHQDVLHLEILEFQKLIEARHITRSRQVKNKMDRLLQESTQRSLITNLAGEKANLNIQIHGYYIDHGFAVSELEKQQLQAAWRQMLPEPSTRRFMDTFFEKVNTYQANMWYRYILLDWAKARDHAHEWVTLFDLYPAMKFKDPDLYMRSLYYLLTMLFLTGDADGYQLYFNQLESYLQEHSPAFHPNSQYVASVYHSLCRLNRYILLEDWQGGYREGLAVQQELKDYENLIDPHRVMLVEYKLAAFAFAQRDYRPALAHLEPLLHHQDRILQYSMDLNARFMELMCLYSLKEWDFMEARLNSLARSMGKHKHISELQKKLYALLRELHRSPLRPPAQVAAPLLTNFERTEMTALDRYFLKYLHVEVWLRSLI